MPNTAPENGHSRSIAKLPIAAAIVALAGLADAIYLTIHHYTAAPVPCGEGFDCEMVLNSSWAEIQGIPLAAFGAVSYFLAFSLALLTAFGDSRMWRLFGILTTLMAAFSGFLIYVQAFRIHAFCQYCLLSAATTFTLLILYLISIFLTPAPRGLNPNTRKHRILSAEAEAGEICVYLAIAAEIS